MMAIGIVVGVIFFGLPAIATGWHSRSWTRGLMVAAASILGPAVGVLLLNLIFQTFVRPTGEDVVGWRFVAVGFGGPLGWLVGVFGSAIVFATER